MKLPGREGGEKGGGGGRKREKQRWLDRQSVFNKSHHANGIRSDTFHFLQITSYSRDASEVTAGQARQSYTSKQINVPRAEERLEPGASPGPAEGLGGERRRAEHAEQNSGALSEVHKRATDPKG